MNLSKTMSGIFIVMTAFGLSSQVLSAEYVIDGSGAGMHTSVSFSASHLGISSMRGRFNHITGHFSYDKNAISSSSIVVSIDPASIDTNLAERDTHLRSGDYMDVVKFPEAGFVSTSIRDLGAGNIEVNGDFTLHGVSKPLSFIGKLAGEGETFFGDYRVGFEAELNLDVADYGIPLAPVSQIKLLLAIEGIRK